MRKFSKVRLIIVFAVMSVMFMIFGGKDIIQEATGSHRNIEDMAISDFRKGDIVKGTITETIGIAVEETETDMIFGMIPSSKRTSAYYYVIPYFRSEEDAFPEKIVLYRTGNREEMDTLDKLIDETYDWYAGDLTRTYNHLTIERAEVVDMDAQDRMYLGEFIDEFVSYLFADKYHDEAYRKYMDAVVPYVVKINRSTGFLFFIGLAILLIGVLLFIFIRSRGRNTLPDYPGYTNYTQQNPGYPQQNPGYPQQNPGYPQQNAGYPQQNSGYPQQNPGYSQQNVGYPQQSPGYPRQNPGYPQQNAGYSQQDNDLYYRSAGFDRFSADDSAYGKPLDGDSMPSVGAPGPRDGAAQMPQMPQMPEVPQMPKVDLGKKDDIQ